MSVTKSDSECTASAIIAALCPSTAATNLNAISATLPALPTSVTLYILRSRSSIYKLFIKHCITTTTRISPPHIEDCKNTQLFWITNRNLHFRSIRRLVILTIGLFPKHYGSSVRLVKD